MRFPEILKFPFQVRKFPAKWKHWVDGAWRFCTPQFRKAYREIAISRHEKKKRQKTQKRSRILDSATTVAQVITATRRHYPICASMVKRPDRTKKYRHNRIQTRPPHQCYPRRRLRYHLPTNPYKYPYLRHVMYVESIRLKVLCHDVDRLL